MIELYIENKKIDLTEDPEISFTYETIDPDKLASIKNSFSKTVNIPGTANNNITFGHIFRNDKYISSNSPGAPIDSFYDPHKKINWIINKNGTIVQRGYCTLDSIDVDENNKITYQLTLYGGLGEFFYSLSYNDDGSPKTLIDVYFNWLPVTEIGPNSLPTNLPSSFNEDSDPLFGVSSDITACQWGSFAMQPLATQHDTSELSRSYIWEDLTFCPCYCGYHNSFDSNKMLVNTRIQYDQATLGYLPAQDITDLKNAFPRSKSNGEETFYALSPNIDTTGLDRYGLAELSRDIDPWEAGDLRVTELPIAIKLSKLMQAISYPVNNNNYEVIWDDTIIHSPYWRYGWILLQKIQKQGNQVNVTHVIDVDNIDGIDNKVDMTYSYVQQGKDTTATRPSVTVLNEMVPAGDYHLSMSYNPNIEFEYYETEDLSWFRQINRNEPWMTGSRSSQYNAVHKRMEYLCRWNCQLLITKMQYQVNDTVNTKCFVEVVYWTTNPSSGFDCFDIPRIPGLQDYNNEKERIKNTFEYRIKLQLGLPINNTVFNYNNLYPYVESEEVLPGGDVFVKCVSRNNINLDYPIELTEDATLTITQIKTTAFFSGSFYVNKGIMYFLGLVIGDYGLQSHPSPEIPTWPTGPGYAGYPQFFGWIENDTITTWPWFNGTSQYKFGFNVNKNITNQLIPTTESSIPHYKALTKQMLFSNTYSPFKYLADFCKLMNYRFICDNVSKKIYIKDIKNYYIDSSIDINDKVDYSRQMNIKPVIAKYKKMYYGLEAPDTYPKTLMQYKSINEYWKAIKDTNIEFNIGQYDVLSGNIYKETFNWQLQSIYFDKLEYKPAPFNQLTLKWNLFKANETTLNTYEFITNGYDSLIQLSLNSIDFIPKISLFDKENKYIPDTASTFMFLTGFVKNYEYSKFTEVTDPSDECWSIWPYVSLSNDNLLENKLNQKRCYIWDFNYSYVFKDRYAYPLNSNVPVSVSWTIPHFSKDLYCKCDIMGSSENTTLIPDHIYTNNIVTIGDSCKTILTNNNLFDTYVFESNILFGDVFNELLTLTPETDPDKVVTYTMWVQTDQYDNVTLESNQITTAENSLDVGIELATGTRKLYLNIYHGATSSNFSWFDKSWKPTTTGIDNSEITGKKYATWHFKENTMYNDLNILNTKYIKQPTAVSPYLTDSDYGLQSSNEFTINKLNYPSSDESYNIYNMQWESMTNDIYNRNSREVTLYVDLTKICGPNDILRHTYVWKGSKWIITKIHNFKLSNFMKDRFTKVTMHKINDLHAWTN